MSTTTYPLVTGIVNATALSGTNTGDVTLQTIGSVPNANGLTLVGQQINLQMCNYSFGGVLVVGQQSIAGGQKTFKATITGESTIVASALTSQTGYLFDARNTSAVTKWGVNILGQCLLDNASASTPALAFLTATSTGIYNPSGNQLSISTTGSRRLNIDGNGFVTIGGNYTDGNGMMQVTTAFVGTPTLALKKLTSQTGDMLQIIDTANTPFVGITVGGHTYFGSNGTAITFTSNTFVSRATNFNTIGLVKLTSQTAPYLVYTDNVGTYIGEVSIAGYHRMPDGAAANPTYSFYSSTDSGFYFNNSTPKGIRTCISGTDIIEVDGNGNIRAFQVHNNATTMGTSNEQDIRSGSDFIPSITNITNGGMANIIFEKVNWLRVGNVVTVSGTGVYDNNSVVDSTFEMDLPTSAVMGAFTGVYQAGGTAADFLSGNMSIAWDISAVVGSTTVMFRTYARNTGNTIPISFTFTYTVV